MAIHHEPLPRSRTVSRSPSHAVHHAHAVNHAHGGPARHSHYPHEAPPSQSRLVRIGQNLLPLAVALLGLGGVGAMLAALSAA